MSVSCSTSIVMAQTLSPTTFHINLHGAERGIGFYQTSLATTLSHVGQQWHQVRAVSFPGVTDAIKGEVCVQVRWYPIGGPEPEPDVLAKCSAVTDAAGAVVDGSAAIASRTSRLSLSVPIRKGSNGSSSSHSPNVSINSPSSSPVTPTHSLPKVHSLPSFPPTASAEPGVIPGEFTEEEKKRAGNRHSLFAVAGTGSSSHSSASTSASSSSNHCLYSSSLYGRMHSDTRHFDDRNFLEHFASNSHIHEIKVWHGTRAILGLQTIFLTHQLRIPAPHHGPPLTTNPSILTLQPDEHLLSIGGRRDDDGIRALTFVTSRQRRSFGLVDESGGSGGLELGEDFVCQAPRGCRVVCLYGGWNSSGVNCFGMVYQHVESGVAGMMPVIVEEERKATVVSGWSDGWAPRGPLTKQNTTRHI